MLHDHTAVDQAIRDRFADLIEVHELADGEATCAICGCTDSKACPGGCWWIPDPAGLMRDICSACEDVAREMAREMARCDDAIAAIEADPDQNVGAIVGWLDWHAEKAEISRRRVERLNRGERRRRRRTRIRANRNRGRRRGH